MTRPRTLLARYHALPDRLRHLSVGWNIGAWSRALEAGLAMIDEGPDSLENLRIGELGAGSRSSIAPIFAALGADATATYYRDESTETLIAALNKEFDLKVAVRKMDLFSPIEGERFDMVLCKSVLGGISRGDDRRMLARALEVIFENMLTDDGILLTMDNLAGPSLARAVRRMAGAGRQGWFYFDRSILHDALPKDVAMRFASNSTLAFGNYPLFGLNSFFDTLDRVVLDRFFPTLHTIGVAVAGRGISAQ